MQCSRSRCPHVYDDIALMAGNERKHVWFKFTANGANPGKIIATM
jgi:hypothetical protein